MVAMGITGNLRGGTFPTATHGPKYTPISSCIQPRAQEETPKPPRLGYNKDLLHLPGTVADSGSLWCEHATPPTGPWKSPHDLPGRPACQLGLTSKGQGQKQ